MARTALLILVTLAVLIVVFTAVSRVTDVGNRPHPSDVSGMPGDWDAVVKAPAGVTGRWRSDGDSPAPPANRGAGSPIGPGEAVWVETIDPGTGRVAMRFRADRYTPAAASSADAAGTQGAFEVDRPVTEFFTPDGRVTIEADAGRVVFDAIGLGGGAGGGDLAGAGSRPAAGGLPRRGVLRGVTLRLYDAERVSGAARADPHGPPDPDTLADVDPSSAALTATVDNLVFDYDTFRVGTGATTIDGHGVAADRVPVRVRGRAADFDGLGLAIWWDERDRRLRRLEIAHGGTATVHDATALGRTVSRSDDTTERLWARPALASSNPADARQAITADRPAASGTAMASDESASDGSWYRAGFDGPVRVTEGATPLAAGARLEIDFLTNRSEVASPPPVLSPAAAAPSSSTPDAGSPTGDSVTIRWDGRLRVEPSAWPASEPPAGGVSPAEGFSGGTDAPSGGTDAVVRLSGTPDDPARLWRHGTELAAAAVTFDARVRRVHLSSGDGVWPGVTVRGEGVWLDATEVVADAAGADLLGPGRLRAEADAADTARESAGLEDASGAASGLWSERGSAEWSAAWSASARVDFAEVDRVGDAPATSGRVVARSARLSGDVAVIAGQTSVRADRLDLTFGRASGHAVPQVEEVVASGEVFATLTDSFLPTDSSVVTEPADGSVASPGGVRRSIRAGRLRLRTGSAPDGPLLVRRVWANASDASRIRLSVIQDGVASELTAGDLDATIGPDGHSVERVEAGGGVTVTRMSVTDDAPDGDPRLTDAMASAERVTMEPGTADAGPRPTVGTAIPAGSLVTLHGSPARPATLEQGGGRMIAAVVRFRPDDLSAEVPGGGSLDLVQPEDEGSRRLSVTWAEGLSADPEAGRIVVRGDVRASTVDADGTMYSAHAREATIDLTRPHEGRPNGPERSGVPIGSQIERVTLTGEVELRGETPDASTGDASPLARRVVLQGQQATVEALVGRFTVPGPGRLLFEDFREADRRATDLASLPGATAVAWSGGMTYDAADAGGSVAGGLGGGVGVSGPGGVTRLRGDVRVVRDQAGRRLRVRAEEVDVTLAAADTPAGGTPAGPAGGFTGDPMGGGVGTLRSAAARGGVSLLSPTATFDAASVFFDAATGRLTAEDGRLAGDGPAAGRFQTLWFDTRREQVERLTRPGAELR